MARTSKFAPSPGGLETQARWRVGDYLRISREDGDKEESDSIGSQKKLLESYRLAHPELTAAGEYIDDGWSGTNFERPRFRKLMEDIRSGTINCVLVKDLSRFGRNYIEVGRYLEMEFPRLNVRFISISDHIDSVADPDSLNNAMVPFKNVMNDEYCRDISNKVRSVLTNKRKRGQFIGSFASYGYLKDPEDHNRLIVDEEAAPVVRDIFRWFIGGESVLGIAKKLNGQGVPNPSAYKRQQGMGYRHPKHSQNDTLWPDSSVRRILQNRLYVGDMVQGRNRVQSYKLQVAVGVPEEEWIVVENTHEAIVDRETFQTAQALFARDQRTPPGQRRRYVLSGYVRCADCKRAMNRKNTSQPYGEYGYYVCSTFKKMSHGGCSKHSIRSDKLEKAVLETLKTHIRLAVSLDEVAEGLRGADRSRQTAARLERTLAAKEEAAAFQKNCKLDLYPDWKSGQITQEEYTALKARFDGQIAKLEEEAEQLRQDLAALQSQERLENDYLTNFLAHRNLDSLTREAVVELVDMIYVHEGGEITIQLKYQDEYQRLLELVQNKDEVLS